MNIKKIEIDNETIYLKNSKTFGWGVVYPIKNDDGSINFYNMITGGKLIKLVMLILVIVIILGVAYEYNINLKNCTKLMEDYNNLKLNLSDINKKFTGYNLRVMPDINISV